MTEADDSRFDEAEAEVERGEAWPYRVGPNPLTIEVAHWSEGHTKFGEAEFLSGRDRSGKLWSVLVGAISLRKPLVEGLVECWDDDEEAFVVVERLGRVEPGEVVSIRFDGDGENAAGQSYPKFRVSRKRKREASEQHEEGGDGDAIPF